MKNLSISLVVFAALFIFQACQNDTPKIDEISLTLNPSGYAPLSAELQLTLKAPGSILVTVQGKHGSASDVSKSYDVREIFEVPVLGLYPNHENIITVSVLDLGGEEVENETFMLKTNPLIGDMPEVTVQQAIPASMVPGFNLVNYFGHDGDIFPQRAFMFDEYGDIRWYLDYRTHPTLNNLFFDNGMQRLENGNLFFGSNNSGAIFEINMLGEIVNTWGLNGYGFHHHVIEKPNGNFLATVNDFSKPTIEDVIIEINRSTGATVRTWDLNESLDNQRRTWEADLADMDVDWFHANSLVFDESDNGIIVSGRTQGTVKLSSTNQVQWILAPHKGWETSGNGTDLKQFLLQPLDATGNPITDQAVLEGETNHPDFEWAWYQHSPILLPNGNLMLFDNGDNRNYNQPGTYSRAVEYEIDEVNRTIKQVWSYGKARGGETYSRIVSKVTYFEAENNVLFTPGAVEYNGAIYGKIVEVDRTSGQVIFEATVTAPQTLFIITFHNILRVGLYE